MSEQIRQAFDASQERKYKRWTTDIPNNKAEEAPVQPPVHDNRTEEQKSFDTYINKQSSSIVAPWAGWGDPTGNTTVSGVGSSSEYGTGTGKIEDVKDGYYFVSSNFTKKGTMPSELEALPSYYGVIETLTLGSSSAKAKIKQKLTVATPSSHTGKEYVRYKKDYNKPDFTEWKEITGGSANITASAKATTLKPEQPATATVTKQGDNLAFAFGIPQGKAGAGGGGGGGSKPDLPPIENTDIKTIEGKFGLNLFNYREMSTDPRFSVNGKTFYLNPKRKLATSDEQRKLFKPYNRIRNNENIHIKAELIKSSDKPLLGNNDLHAKLYYNNLHGDPTILKDLFFTYNQTETTETINHTQNYSYLTFEMGGEKQPQNGKIKYEAWYGDFSPSNLEQKFEFITYNGVKLLKTCNQVRDEYVHSKLHDKVNKRLNICNLKDLEVVDVKLTGDEANKLVYLQVPDDCWKVKQDERDNFNKFKEAIMSSNLCDIYEADDQGNPQTKPFFFKTISEQTKIDKITKEVKSVFCFVLLIPKEKAGNWNHHLGKTQVVYPICDTASEVVIPLQKGGWIFTLNSGQTIYTHNYAKITTEKRTITFKDSEFGYPDISVDADNVASVVLHSGDAQPLP